MSDLYSVGSLVKIKEIDITIKEKGAIKSVNNKILYQNVIGHWRTLSRRQR